MSERVYITCVRNIYVLCVCMYIQYVCVYCTYSTCTVCVQESISLLLLMTLYSELMGDHMTCNDIITSQKCKCTHYHIHSHESTFLGLADMEWRAVVARRPDWV